MAWSKSLPIASTKVKTADDAYRANWAAIQDAVNREHESITSATSGGVELPSRCGIVKVDTYANIDTLSDIEGAIAFATDDWDFYINDSTGWVRSRQVETSACAFFYQDTAPTGWTLLTTIDDKILMINSAVGGSTSGSWTISGVGKDAPHAHTYTQIPNHTHSLGFREVLGGTPYVWGFYAGPNYASLGTINYAGTASPTTDSTTETEATSDASWRPKANVGIFCTKD